MATWDGTNALRALTLSAGNTVATSNGGAIESCRSSDGKSSGKWYAKIQATTVQTDQPYRWVLGFQDGTYDPNVNDNIQGFESAGNSLCIREDGFIEFKNGQASAVFASPLVSGDFVEICVDVPNQYFWYRRIASGGTPDGAGWNPGGSSPDPAAGTGPIRLNLDLSSPFNAAPWYFGFGSAGSSNNVATIVTGSPPSGFTDWNAGGATGVTWNSADKDPGISLTDADLTAYRP